ncbi:MAG: hypothetical protein LBQ75_01735 [Zoogloeaceae bacterium]|jgi:hypothetical protein|nr:hypothetical protein [Zoogloeaceae bacterium]
MPFGRPSALRFPLLCLCCLALAGCSYLSFISDWWRKEEPPPPEPYLPVPTQFPISSQFRLEAGKHWQSIAEDSARALVHGMRRHRCMPGKGCRPIYIAMPEVETWFSRIFVESLITALVSQNVEITKVPDAALALHIDVNSLKFGYGDKAGSDRKVRQLMPNLWASNTESREPTPVSPQLFPARSSHCEIFVTLSVLDGARYITRNSQLYYVSTEDLRLYEQRICSRLNPCEGGKTEGSPFAIPPKTGTLKIVDEPNGRNDTKK